MQRERRESLRTELRSERSDAGEIGERVCLACIDLLVVDGAGIMLVDGDGHLSTMGVSDRSAARLEDLQFVLGEGPGLDAHRSGRPVLEPDLLGAAGSRWTAYGPAAASEGIAAVFAFPLRIGDARLGALTVYRRVRGSLEAERIESAVELTQFLSDSLVSMQAIAADGTARGIDLAGGLRAGVHQAAGMVSEQLDIAIGDALARLRAYAYAADRPIDDVARDVVDHRLRIDRPPE